MMCTNCTHLKAGKCDRDGCQIDPIIPTPKQEESIQIGGNHYIKMPIQPIDFIMKNGI